MDKQEVNVNTDRVRRMSFGELKCHMSELVIGTMRLDRGETLDGTWIASKK